MSTPPNRSAAAFANASQRARSWMSTPWKPTRSPDGSSSAAMRSSFASVRAPRNTFAPSRSAHSAMRCPRPVPTPEMTMVWPSTITASPSSRAPVRRCRPWRCRCEPHGQELRPAQRLVARHVLVAIEVGERHGDALRVHARDLRRHGDGLVEEALRREHRGGEPAAHRFLAVDHLSGEDDLLRLRDADELRPRVLAPQPPRPVPRFFRCQSLIWADGATRRKSQASASSAAPVVHTPSMTAIEGFSRSSMSFVRRSPVSRSTPMPSEKARRSTPAPKFGRPSGRGAPVRIKTRMSGSFAIRATARASSSGGATSAR